MVRSVEVQRRLSIESVTLLECSREQTVDLRYGNEVEGKKNFSDLIGICAGEKASTEEEYRKAVYGVFKRITAYRSSNRIDGDFVGAGMKQRIDELEAKQNATGRLVEQFVRWFREEYGI